MTIRTISSRWI